MLFNILGRASCDCARGFRSHGILACILLWVAALCAPWDTAHAETVSAESDATWEFRATPYIWALALDGDIEAGRVDAEISSSFSDILDVTNVAVMLILEARHDRFSIVVDSLFADLEDDEASIGPFRLDATSRQLVLDSKLGYRVWASEAGVSERESLSLDLMAGGRYVSVDNEIELSGANLGRDVDDRFAWVDPTVGFRFRGDITRTTSFTVTGDVGGFGVGEACDFTWSAIAVVSWHASPHWVISAGYKALDLDRSKIDLREQGPVLGFTYAF